MGGIIVREVKKRAKRRVAGLRKGIIDAYDNSGPLAILNPPYVYQYQGHKIKIISLTCVG